VDLAFEWDERKARANLRKHLVSFLTTAAIFEDDMLERVDDREDYGKVRWVALGRVDEEVYRFVYTWRGGDVIRVISAQKASRDEREIYYRATFGDAG
jgi:uncharacterized DUF497 family protein